MRTTQTLATSAAAGKQTEAHNSLFGQQPEEYASRLMKKSKRRLLCRTAAIVSSLFSA